MVPLRSVVKCILYGIGLIVSFGLYAFILEKLTLSRSGPNEFCIMLICCSFYSLIAWTGRLVTKEKETTAPWQVFVVLSITTFLSSYTSILALRHVSYLMKILGKTCKPLPILVIGSCWGKTYSMRKHVSVMLIVLGASIFMLSKEGAAASKDRHDSIMGVLLIVLSLCFDGATGALEDKCMKKYQIQPFGMMHLINSFSVMIALTALVLSGNIPDLLNLISSPHQNDLIFVGFSGGMGQVFIYLMICEFGALLTSVMGTLRKICSITASIYFFGHVLNTYQWLGIVSVFIGMLVNLIRGRQPQHKEDQAAQFGELEEVEELLQEMQTWGVGPDENENSTVKDDKKNNATIRRQVAIRKSSCDWDASIEALPASLKINDESTIRIILPPQDDPTYAKAIDAIFRATTAV